MNGKVFNSYSNYMVVSASKNFNVNLQYSHTYLKNESLPFVPNQKVSGNLIRVTTVSSHFQVLAPHGRCCQPESNDNQPCKERTSDTAKLNECIVATNAGFFDVAHGYCLGRVVSGGKLLNKNVRNTAVFALVDDKKGDAHYVYGYLNETDYASLKISQMIQVSEI